MIYSTIKSLTEPAMWICFATAIACSGILSRKISPINKYIENEIRKPSQEASTLPTPILLTELIKKYEQLFETVDEVNAGDFALSQVHSIRVRIFFAKLSAEKIQDFIGQAPALLISLGLLGTFAGLTGGLGEIQSVLGPGLSPQEAAGGLSKVVAPMALAFKTSLLGLVLSLALTITYQITGWKDLLSRCEGLITGWLEAIAPIQMQRKLKTPLRKSIDSLNKTIYELPKNLSRIVAASIEEAFADRLDQFFNLYANLSAETQRTINSLTSLTSAWHEGSSDFLSASEILANSTFALELHTAVDSLAICKSELVTSSNQLCERFATFRDNLIATQTDWTILTKLSAEELQKSNKLAEAIKAQQEEINELITTNKEGSIEIAQASKELRKSRLDLGRDFRALQSTAISIQEKFEGEEQILQANKKFISNLNELLSNWRSTASETLTFYKSLIEIAKAEASDTLSLQVNQIKQNEKRLEDRLKKFNIVADEIEKQHTEFIHEAEKQVKIMTELLGQLMSQNQLKLENPNENSNA